MNPDSGKRLTIIQCLEHPWLKGNCKGDDLGDIQSALKSYQARKRMKGAILGVMATNKMRNSLSHKLTQLAQEPVVTTTPKPAVTATTTTTTTSTTPIFTELVVKVCSGRNLAVKDANGKSDPYLNLWCGSSKNKTQIKKKTLDPEWNETFTIPFAVCVKKDLDVECWDYDTVGKDEFMGEFKLSVDSIPINETLSNWYTLEASNVRGKKGKVSGEILLELTKK